MGSQTGRVPGGSSQSGGQVGGSSQTGRVPGGSSQTGSQVGGGSSQSGLGLGPPAYLSIPGFSNCLEEHTPAGASHTENCLPQNKPRFCQQQAWEELQSLFEGNCPSNHGKPDIGQPGIGLGPPAYL